MTETELNISIGDKIAAFRKEHKVTQEIVAEALGLSRTSVVNIEQGRQSCDAHRIYQFAGLFGKQIQDFFPPLLKYEIVTTEEEVIIRKTKKKLSLKIVE